MFLLGLLWSFYFSTSGFQLSPFNWALKFIHVWKKNKEKTQTKGQEQKIKAKSLTILIRINVI